MRRRIRAAHADVDQRHAEANHLRDPRERLGQVGPQRIVGIGAPGAGERRLIRTRLAVIAARRLAIGNRIIDVDPTGDYQAGHFTADRGDDVARQPGAILQAAAVESGSLPGREQFAQQVAMALLDIDELIADPVRTAGGGDIRINQSAQLVVRQQRIGRVELHARIEERIVHRKQRPAIAVAPRVRELQADHEVIVAAERFAMRLPAHL